MLSANEYDKKVKQLIEWSKSYYDNDRPEVSDYTYDRLYHDVLQFETKNGIINPESPTQKIAAVKGKVKHQNRMWSQQDIFNVKELEEWYYKVGADNNISFTVEPKFDGLSLKLIYKKGKLYQAITRGNGVYGDDVTNIVRHIDNIPKALPVSDDLEISGEIVMLKSDFKKLNELRAKEKLELFANPRNIAVGTLKSLDPAVLNTRKLTFYPWDIANSLYVHENHIKFKEYGFKTIDKVLHTKSLQDIVDFYNMYIEIRDSLDVMLDGLVIKVDEVSTHDAFGYTAKHPKWSVALKFPPTVVDTILEDVEWDIGRLGNYSPVGIVTPTYIDGTTVSKVYLHNMDIIKSYNLRLGDKIEVIKSGDIIPKLVGVLVHNNGDEIIPPKNCLYCGDELTQNGTEIKCTNTKCKGIAYKSITFYAGREYMNIDGLGGKVVKLLVDYLGVKNPIDLYSITKNDLLKLELFSDKKSENLIKAINSTKGKELHIFIASLGIETIGRTISRKMVDRFGDKVFNLTKDQLLTIDGMGDIMADNFLNYIKNNKMYIDVLYSVVKPSIKQFTPTSDKFVNKTFVLTGSFANGKKSLEKDIVSKSGAIKSSVTKDTDYLIVGDNPGTKLDKAKKLNIRVISYEEYLNL